ncbi:MAG: hypothetical protein MJ106_05650 [Lentisphaeria bacterium]|nr:hypothetical protein [Lentisphaeria bacterium]
MSEIIPPIRPNYNEPNFDETKIASYSLEDPLTFVDGTRVLTPGDWEARRKEILGIFSREMYGQEPPPPKSLVIEKVQERSDAIGGLGIRSLYKMWFRTDKFGPCINWILIRPKYAKGPVPVILMLNRRGNHELIPDEDIEVPNVFCPNDAFIPRKNNRPSSTSRGYMSNPNSKNVLPIGTILAEGYALLSACYCEVSPDPAPDWEEPNVLHRQTPFAYTGVFSLWGKRDNSREDNTTSLGAWAWALSRGMDLVEGIPELDSKRAIVLGHARLGKAAFLAAARDERFGVAILNQCGGGSVRLAKHDLGENIATEMLIFSHWFCKAYAKYARNPARLLTFDQHLLLASLAPRRVLVQGFNSVPWMETKSEYIACRAASPAWEFLGLPGLPGTSMPEPFDTSAIGPYLGYVQRSEYQGLSAYDWKWALDFIGKK